MSLTAARPAGGDKPRPYILRVSGDRKYVVGAAFMAARGRPQGSPLRCYALGRVPRLSPFRVGADAPRRPLLLLWGNSPSAHIGPPCAGLRIFHMTPFGICFLVLPPAGPCDGSLLAAKPLRSTLQTCRWHVCFTLRFRFPPP